MGTIHRFPGAASPEDLKVVGEEISRAMALLEILRARIPRNAEHSDAEHELEVLGRAIQALQAARPLYALPAEMPQVHLSALIDEALVLADLSGQAIHQLDPSRQVRVLPIVLHALADAVESGPEALRPPFPEPIRP